MALRAILLLSVGLAACSGGANLDGTSWVLESMGPEPLVIGSVITLTFVGQEARGSGGCNEYFGEYTTSGDGISFGPMASTRMACGEAIDQQEFAYMSALQAAETYEVAGGRLTIAHQGGTLTFGAQ